MKLDFENTEVAFRGKSTKELQKAHYLFALIGSPTLTKIGSGALEVGLKIGLPLSWAVKPTIYSHFCGGVDIVSSLPKVKALWNNNVSSILDYSVEGKESVEDFDTTTNTIIDTIKISAEREDIPFAVFKVTGVARHSFLERLNYGLDNLDEKEMKEYHAVANRIDRICEAAFLHHTRVLIDAEESWIQDAIDNLVHLMMSRYNKERVVVYNTVQFYRHDRLKFLQQAVQVAKVSGYKYAVKIVRGAYLEKETERSEELGYQNPINKTKESTDDLFNAGIEYILNNLEDCHLVCGSHNEHSNKFLAELMIAKGLEKNDSRIYFSQLLGMSDNISFVLADHGYNVSKYVPFGPVKEVMPYLIRRAEENTSISGQTGRELSLIKREIDRRRNGGK